MKKYNIGVIGIGDISNVYINNLKEYKIVNLLACAGRSLEKAQLKAKEHGIPKAYGSSQELINDPEIDIVLNLTLPAVHAEITRAALEAGKHVYSEKPLGATFEEGQALVNLAKEKGLYLGCAPDTFLGSRIQTCKEMIDNGEIGEIIAASAFVVSHGHEWFHPNPAFFYQKGGGPLLDIGPYYITALLALLGPVKSCSAFARKSFDTRVIQSEPLKGKEIPVDVDTHITAGLQFQNGALVTLIASFDVWDSELPRIEIYGTKGTICISDIDPVDGPNLFGGEILKKDEANYRWKGLPRTYPLQEWEVIKSNRPFNETSHQKNSRGIGLIDMIYAIRDQRESRASAQMALHSLEVMEGILTSAKEQKYYSPKTSFIPASLLPENFPESEEH